MKKPSSLESLFIVLLKSEKIFKNFTLEYKFLENRKFRFDFADVKNKIAIELEGGVFINGGHTRGKGYISNVEKYNLAVAEGWRLLRACNKDQMLEIISIYKDIK